MTENRLAVLLIDDDHEDHFLVREMLSEIAVTRYQVTPVETYEEGLAALLGGTHDVCLLDYRLQDRTGIELLVEAQRARCETPVLLITGLGDATIDREAMAAGASDYMSKEQLHPALLERAIRYAIRHKQHELELKHVTRSLEDRNRELLAMHDELARKNAELSAPAVPISDDVVLMPLIGALDRPRTQQVLDTLLHAVSIRGSRVAIVDITGVVRIDADAAGALVKIVQAARLLGVRMVITGVRPQVAQTMVEIDVDLGGAVTRATLQSGIAYALRLA